jgi:dynein heavy chain
LDNVLLIFQEFKDAPPIHSYMAPITGALSWTHELKDRGRLRGDACQKKYNELYATLEAYEKNLYNSWTCDISDESEANLHKPLIIKGKDGLLLATSKL